MLSGSSTPGRDVLAAGEPPYTRTEVSHAGEVHEVLRADRALRRHRVVRRPSVSHGLPAPPHVDRRRARPAVRLLLRPRRRLLLELRPAFPDGGTGRRCPRKPHEPVPSLSSRPDPERPRACVQLRDLTRGSPTQGAGRTGSGAAPREREPATPRHIRRPDPRGGSPAVRAAGFSPRSYVAEDSLLGCVIRLLQRPHAAPAPRATACAPTRCRSRSSASRRSR